MRKILIILSSLYLTNCNNSASTKDAHLLLSNSFETLDGWLPDEQSVTLTRDQAHSGKIALKVDDAHEYSLGYSNTINRLYAGSLTKIRVSAWALIPNNQASASLVTTITNPITPDSKPIVWQDIKLNKTVNAKGKWTEVSRMITIPSTVKSSYKLNIYLWRTSSNLPVYIDDLKVTVVP